MTIPKAVLNVCLSIQQSSVLSGDKPFSKGDHDEMKQCTDTDHMMYMYHNISELQNQPWLIPEFPQQTQNIPQG